MNDAAAGDPLPVWMRSPAPSGFCPLGRNNPQRDNGYLSAAALGNLSRPAELLVGDSQLFTVQSISVSLSCLMPHLYYANSLFRLIIDNIFYLLLCFFSFFYYGFKPELNVWWFVCVAEIFFFSADAAASSAPLSVHECIIQSQIAESIFSVLSRQNDSNRN